ncbi:MAG: MoxR family ATPase [Candidatus Delongbacteria bacterium]|nr:MoxR family ATPase [Candidatus Delongbacteria bacterium]
MDNDQFNKAFEIYSKIKSNIISVFKGDPFNIDLLLSGFFTNGHILLEDYPGTGKTTLAKALALSVETEFKRIQFTPDLLPTDITGVNIFNVKDREFHLQKGPVFTNILLADEINRTTSRTQSALLEAMEEKQVTIDGEIYSLNDDFFVVATLNPAELQGTYPLPESQIDRFALRFSLGYVSKEEEIEMLDIKDPSKPLENLTSCSTVDDVLLVRSTLHEIQIHKDIKDFIVELVRKTREHEGILIGASPRASIGLQKLSKVLALSENKEFVTPDHVIRLAPFVLSHRLIFDQFVNDGETKQKDIIDNIIKETPVPK